MASFLVVISVLLCFTSGNPVHSNYERTEDSYFSPKEVRIIIFCLFFKVAILIWLRKKIGKSSRAKVWKNLNMSSRASALLKNEERCLA